MNTQTRTINALTGALAGVAFLGCAGMQVRTDSDSRVNLTKYETFDVKTGQVLVNGVVDERNTLVRDRVESALQLELEEKGLEPAAEDPDLIVTYTAGARDVVGIDNNWTGGPYGYGYYGYGYGRAPVDEYSETALLIDMIDPKTNKLVWRSVVEMGDDDLRSAKNITKAVNKALEEYPGA